MSNKLTEPDRMMSNFSFIPHEFGQLGLSSKKAEKYICGDARAACFHARFALESGVQWVYRHVRGLELPYDTSLGALLHDPGFREVVPEAVFQKARVIQKVGNQAVHSQKLIKQYDALQVVRELFHFCYWLGRAYGKGLNLEGVAWSDEKIPARVDGEATLSREKLVALEKQLEEQNKLTLKQQQEKDALNEQLEELQAELAELRAQSENVPDSHDYSEVETRAYLIDVDLARAGWPLDQVQDREYEVQGMPNPSGVGYVDYVLWGEDGKPLAVVEAKKSTVDSEVGRQQAKLYADCLESMHGQRPLIFYTNGYETWLWDDQMYPPRKASGFYKREELEKLIRRRTLLKDFAEVPVNQEIAGRYYQKRAIASICGHFANKQRKALLVMATGTGKTRTSIALVDVLQRANWAKRVLFLADRKSLVKQACNAFKAHLADSSPVNLVTEKDVQGRVYVCTYPTMMGLIDETDGGEAKFGSGHFDLIIVDEAHRSIYQRYREIFRYFDALLVGLTATPRDQIDRNTYELFDLESGVPTDAYELQKAVDDGFLVPPQVGKVDLKFPTEGIVYDKLSEEEKAMWENMDWGDDAPEVVHSSAINKWLFNEDTVDKMLKHLMENGLKVEDGDRLGKTIIFARNHDHAVFIEQRFNHHYPHYRGEFARVIDNQETYAQSLIDDFSLHDKVPHIAISVDMMDTGIDVTEVLNLVFFKPVYSKIKFWQMIGRGTRLCPDLFGPGQDKECFRIFDFCSNFDFFQENPEGIETGDSIPLGTRLFSQRARLIQHLQKQPELESDGQLQENILELLQKEVSSMPRENFLVRAQLASVEKFQNKDNWSSLDNHDVHELESCIAGLPTELEDEPIETRRFDLILLKMQLALVENNAAELERGRRKVAAIAEVLEEKDTIPAIQKQLAFIRALQDTDFWDPFSLEKLEEIRLRLRDLNQFVDGRKKARLYSKFKDEVMEIREDTNLLKLPSMTGAQYEKKVKAYLQEHANDLTIQRLRQNEPLTAKDLQALEERLVELGEKDGKTLLKGLLEHAEAPSLPYFVRSLVGMDQAAAKAAFGEFLRNHSLNERQIRFVDMIVEQLTTKGVMSAAALYEAPFTNFDSLGPDGVFAGNDQVIDGLFVALKETQPILEPEEEAG